jgi:hypothetical protein
MRDGRLGAQLLRRLGAAVQGEVAMMTRLLAGAAAVAAATFAMPTYAEPPLGGVEVPALQHVIRISMVGKDYNTAKSQIFRASEVVCRNAPYRDPLWDLAYGGVPYRESYGGVSYRKCWGETSEDGLAQARRIVSAQRRAGGGDLVAQSQWIRIAAR